MKNIFINVKDYEKLKKGEEIELIVEAKNREPIVIWASCDGTYSSCSSRDTGYENAVFNGECD